jgi:hypothetical protein
MRTSKRVREPVRCISATPHGRHETVGIRRGYQHAHKFEDAIPAWMPAAVASGKQYYQPTSHGLESASPTPGRSANFAAR